MTTAAEYTWRTVAAPASGRGRPRVGAKTTIRLDPVTRARIDAASMPGETLAAAVRRLAGLATDPALADALADAAEFREHRAGRVCPQCWLSAELAELCAHQRADLAAADRYRQLAGLATEEGGA
jgi:hypothetical protein